MKNFLKSILRKPITICIVVIILLSSGIFAAIKMPVNLIPNMKMPILGVTVVYPGASADSVQEQVTNPLEDNFKSIASLDSMSTYSMDNVSMIMLSYDYNTDLDKEIDKLNKLITAVNLPSACEDAQISAIDFNASSIATISVSHPEHNMALSRSDATALSSELKKIDGVERIELSGLPVSSISVSPNKGFELATLLLVQALQTSNSLDIPLGSIVSNGEYVSIRNDSKPVNIEQINKLPIQLPLSQAEIDTYKSSQATLNQVINFSKSIQSTIKQSLNDKSDEEIYNILKVDPNFSAFSAFLSTEFVHAIRVADISTDEGIYNYFNSIPNPIISSMVSNLDAKQLKFALNTDFNKYSNGTLNVTLADIATVTLDTDYASKSTFNGRESINIDIFCSNNANITQVVDNVKRTMKSAKTDLNLASDITLINDQAKFIKDSISNMLSSMLIGGILAILVIYLFLRQVRTSLVISITMPLAVLMALICMHLMGITFNMVSIGGLAVGIGMLIDNSIVVIESIIRRRDTGEGVYSSAYNGVIDVAGSLFASTLTTICVFFPILFTSGLTKEIFADLSWAVVFSLSFSLIVALTIIPTLYCLLYRKDEMLGGSILGKGGIQPNDENQPIMSSESNDDNNDNFVNTPKNATILADSISDNKKVKKQKKVKKPKQNVGALTRKMEHMYENVLRACMNRKLLVVIIALVAFLSSSILVFNTGVEFLPSIDQGLLEVNIKCGASASISDAENKTTEIANLINENVEHIDIMSASVGKNGLLATANSGYIKIQMNKDAKATKDVVEDIRDLCKNVSGATISISEIDGIVASLTSGMGGISVTVSGKDNDVLKEISDKVKDKIMNIEGFTEIHDDITQESTEFSINFDKNKCVDYNVDYMVLIQTLRTGIAGLNCGSIEDNDTNVNVNVKFADGTLSSLNDLNEFVVGNKDGLPVHLSQISTVSVNKKNSIIKKANGLNLMTLTVGTYGIDTGKASKELNKVVNDVLTDYEGYSFSSSGVQSYLSTSFKGLLIAMIISILLLYGVMACQFESFVKPFIVMMSIPLTFTGAFLAIFITRTTLNLVSFIGIIMLMGVIVNNAIIMLDKIKQLTDEGMDPYEAVIKGCSSRLRAILMTTLTTVLALLPLSLGLGQGGELMQPMGIAVMGGLILGCLVTLVLIPAIYMGIKKIKKPSKTNDKTEEKLEQQA